MIGETTQLLLVEDDPLSVRLLQNTLERSAFAHELTVTGSLREAIDRAAGRSFDLVLLDLDLPDSSGLDTIHRMRQAAPQLSLVVLTGSDAETLGTSALQAGARDYLVKGEIGGRSLIRSLQYALERKRSEEAERDRMSLHDAVRAMEQVLTVIGHELRTPLASLQVMSELLMGDEQPMPLEQLARSIHEQTHRLADTLNTLLQAARLENGITSGEWGEFSLDEVWREVQREVCGQRDAQSVRLSTSISADLRMKGDRECVQRLIHHLVSNALRHTSSGAIEVAIREHAAADGRRVRIEINDTGSGIAPQVIQRIGEPFALNSGAVGGRHAAGSGFGLVYCKFVAAAHGGEMRVTSTPGRGTRFRIDLRADLDAPIRPADNVRIVGEVSA